MRKGGWMVLGLGLLACGCGEALAIDGDASAPSDAGAIDERGEDAGPAPTLPLPRPEPGPAEPEPEPDAEEPFTCEGKTGAAGDHALVLSHGGLLRRVLLHVPASYDPAAGAMLVLNFHGFSSADWQQSLLTHMNRSADERGFLVAYPQGVATSWNAGDCCGTAWVDGVDDVGFVRALLDRLERDYCVDPRRVHATGMSNGGFMAHRLACELDDRIASIAPVAGVLGLDGCSPSRPVPVFHFHGTEDRLVPYAGGTPVVPELGAGLVFRAVAETMEHWRLVNGCEPAPIETLHEGDATCLAWQGCAASTRLCTVDGGGHTWPGGMPVPFLGHTSDDLDATDAMIDFFDAHPMPR